MSRTYKCTKGSSKKLIPYFENLNDFKGYMEERRKPVDYIDGTDPQSALIVRKGMILRAPKSFKQGVKKAVNAKLKMHLITKLKNGEFDSIEKTIDKKNVNYLYY